MKNKSTWDLVIKDMKKRELLGLNRYGITLNVDTKKDMLQEHYEELLDAVVYIKTLLEQRKLNASK